VFRTFHNLTGTAGVFGFDRITDLCQIGENRCKELTRTEEGPAEADIDAWEALVAGIRDLLTPTESNGTGATD
jgi:chemotaxis protein histidine kinase CheA